MHFVEQNQLVTLPESFGDLQSLDTAYMYDNQLTSLPESIGNLKNLEVLFIKENKLNESEKEKIIKLLPNCEISIE